MIFLDGLRRLLAQPATSVQLGLLGVLAGLASALVIILFRQTIAIVQELFLQEPDNFTQLDLVFRSSLPLIAVFFMLLIGIGANRQDFRMGIAFAIHWIRVKKGAMPFRNAFYQFFGGAAALISGFSVGREGPSVHIGATMASYVGDILHLPYNSIRTLTGCGIAAGIAASFNTPLAAVVFVMEVVFREYKIHVFVPIMLAAVTGTLLTRYVFGDSHELSVFSQTSFSDINYAYLILCSIVISGVAFLFNSSIIRTAKKFKPIKIYYRLAIAAMITAWIGVLVPEALGSGMGAIQYTLTDGASTVEWTAFLFILGILLAKFIATVFALGLGVPGGVIGPILGIGALLGSLFGLISQFAGFSGDHVALYSVMAMAGLMAATLHSPLAALLAIFELTTNPDLILPAMLVIAVSYTVSVQVFGNRSIFIQQLDAQQLDYQISPAMQTLQKIGVLTQLNRNFKLIYDENENNVRQLLASTPQNTSVIYANLDIFSSDFKLVEFAENIQYKNNSIAINNSQINFIPMQGLSAQATLAEAFELIHHQREGAVFIYQGSTDNIIGIIKWDQLRQLLIERNNFL